MQTPRDGGPQAKPGSVSHGRKNPFSYSQMAIKVRDWHFLVTNYIFISDLNEKDAGNRQTVSKTQGKVVLMA